MRLYLSSRRLGNNPLELSRLAEGSRHAGIILNAGDGVNGEHRMLRLKKQAELLRGLGFTSEEIDLRKFFGKKKKLREFMKKFGIVWVRGGNIFFLKRAYEQSGFDSIIKDMLQEDSIVYAGDSAGAVILGPTLKGLELTSSIDLVPEGYKTEFSMDGLGVIDYIILPHYKSGHPDSPIVEVIADEFQKRHVFHKTLRDGEVIVINGKEEKTLS